MNTKLSSSKSNGSIGHEGPTHDEIAHLAYQLYVEHGRRDGHDFDDWLLAKRLLAERASRLAPVPAHVPTSTQHIQPLDSREYPFARAERGSASREEIHRQTTQMRPAARQSLRRPERSGVPR